MGGGFVLISCEWVRKIEEMGVCIVGYRIGNKRRKRVDGFH